jgi:hypothetical protein
VLVEFFRGYDRLVVWLGWRRHISTEFYLGNPVRNLYLKDQEGGGEEVTFTMHLRGMDCENGGLLELAENLVQLRNWLY